MVLILFSYRDRKIQLHAMLTRIKEMSSTSPYLSLAYGVIAGIASIIALVAIFDWSIVASIPTTREIGVIFSLVFLLFPFFFLREFYLRGFIQERLK
jgi:hypothetical protein